MKDLQNVFAIGAPAAGIYSTVTDMNKWLLSLVTEGKQLVPSSTLQNMLWKGHMLSPFVQDTGNIIKGPAGLGWMLEYYRNTFAVFHGGNGVGYTTYMYLIPSYQAGFVIMMNVGNFNLLRQLLTYYIADMILGYESWIPQSKWCGDVQGSSAVDTTSPQPDMPEPYGKFDDVIGNYSHPFYGSISIYKQDAKYLVQYNKWPVGYIGAVEKDAFHIFFPPSSLSPNNYYRYVAIAYRNNTYGDVDRISLILEDSVNPIVFTEAAYKPKGFSGNPAFSSMGFTNVQYAYVPQVGKSKQLHSFDQKLGGSNGISGSNGVNGANGQDSNNSLAIISMMLSIVSTLTTLVAVLIGVACIVKKSKSAEAQSQQYVNMQERFVQQ